MRQIVIIDDNYDIIRSIEDNFSDHSYKFHSFTRPEKALAEIKNINPEIILLDLLMPVLNGFEVLEKLQSMQISAKVIVISGENKINYAVKAIKLGAHDYITKPFDFEHLEKTINQYLQIKNINKNQFNKNQIIGESAEIKAVHKTIEKLSKSYDTTILIQGETGTGKELVARALHFQSQRQNMPFIEINCSAIQENLLESELFGHEKGAFTGAETQKKGLLEIANGGTFFLDEIGDMPLNLQSKLLKVLEQKKFRRIGGLEEIEVDVRFLCATSQNLKKRIKSNRFREDLYFRINVACINLPPLISRKSDIPVLAEYFLHFYNIKFQKNITTIDADAYDKLLKYPWPGNIRELKNKIERAVLFEEAEVLTAVSLNIEETPKNTSDENHKPLSPCGNLSLDELEKNLIIKALQQAKGNQNKAAKILKISRETLRYRLKKHKIEPTNIKNS